MPSYKTLAAACKHEIPKIKGSRFLAFADPITTREEAEARVRALRREFHAARHVCSAWRIGQSDEGFHFDDDGEPSGSAGRPILQQIDGHELTNLVVAVVRYFGGTKLGVGGLVRAYGQASKEVLEAAPVLVVVPKQRIEVSYPYPCESAVQALVAAWKLGPSESEYAEEVRLVFEVPEEEADRFVIECQDRCAGKARIQRGDLC